MEAGLIDGSGGTRPPRAYHRTQADASRYQRWGVIYMGAIYVGLVAALLGVVPLVGVVPLIVVAYVRGALLTHELMHIRRPEQVTWMLRMMMLFDTLFCLGYREHQNIHLRHHRRPATARDPEYFQIRGGRVRAFFAALLGPELTALHWVRTQGLSRSLAREASIRAAIMLALITLNPSVFVGYWIVLRLTVGISNYMFHHVLHYRAGGYGTFQLRMPWPLDAGLRLTVGSSLAAVLTEHDAHHAWCNVRAENLRGLLRRFPLGSPTESSL